MNGGLLPVFSARSTTLQYTVPWSRVYSRLKPWAFKALNSKHVLLTCKRVDNCLVSNFLTSTSAYISQASTYIRPRKGSFSPQKANPITLDELYSQLQLTRSFGEDSKLITPHMTYRKTITSTQITLSQRIVPPTELRTKPAKLASHTVA